MKTKRLGSFLLSIAGLFFWQPSAQAISVRCDRLFENAGPVVRLELPGTQRDPGGARLKRIKIGHYSLNTFNLTQSPNSRSNFTNNEAVIAAIEFERPDVLTLSEVMNRETLAELSRRLNDLYEPIMIEGNGDVSLAVLVRKSLPLLVEVESNRSIRHEYMGNLVPLFTRDLLLIHLSLPKERRTLLSIAAGHFKAQKNNFVRDPFFAIKREAEERGALELLDTAARLRSSQGRILIGDLNSDVRRSNEMLNFKKAGYQEAFDLLGISMERRTSHAYFPQWGTPSYWQTDAAFVSADISFRNALLGGHVSVDRTKTGRVLERPRTIEELRTRGSDHQMIVVEIDIGKLK